MQANKYPTFNKTISYYFKILKKLVVINTKSTNVAIKNAASVAYLALNNYYSKTKDLLALYIAIICNLKYKIKAFCYSSSTGVPCHVVTFTSAASIGGVKRQNSSICTN